MTEYLIGVISGITGAILIKVGIIIYHKIKIWYSFKPFYQIWQPFTSPSTAIFITGKKIGHTLKVSVNEVDAARTIQSLISRKDEIQVSGSKSESFILEKNNIISLGSEHVNDVTYRLLSSVANRIGYEKTVDNDLILDGKIWQSEYNENDVLVKDYGFICRAPNPFSKGKKFLVLAGNHGIGTQGAVEAITSKKLINDIIQEAGDKDFYAIVEVHIDEHYGRKLRDIIVCKCGFIPAETVKATPSFVDSRKKRLDEFISSLEASQNYFDHVRPRAELAVRIANAIQTRGKDIDIDAVYFATMLHDIGRIKSNAIDHGSQGANIVRKNELKFRDDFALKQDTIKEISRAIECHVLGGIRPEWIEEIQENRKRSNLPELNIPIKEYKPESLEAKIVSFSDQILHDRDREREIIFTELPQYDIEIYRQFYRLTYDIVSALFPREK